MNLLDASTPALPSGTPPESVLLPLLGLAATLADCPCAWIARVEAGTLSLALSFGFDRLQDPAPRPGSADPPSEARPEAAPAADPRRLTDLAAAHALLAPGWLLVDDATADARFAAHAARLDGEPLRWIAGVPLAGPDGLAFGALCLADVEVRPLHPRQQLALQRLATSLVGLHAQARHDAAQARAAEQRAAATLAAQAAATRIAQGALNAAEARFRRLSESSPVGVFHADAEGRITFTNTPWQQMFGLSPQEALGTRWLETVHADDRSLVRQAWTQHTAGSAEFRLDFRVVHADGSVRVLRSSSRAVGSSPGQQGGFVGNVTDITEHLRTIDRLRASETFLDRTGRIANVGGWEYDLQTRRLLWSAQTARIHERLAGQVAQPDEALQYYAPEARTVIEAAVGEAARSGAPFDLELPVVTATGRPLWVRVFGEAERENGRIVRVVGAYQDITDRRLRQAELQQEQDLRIRVQAHALQLDRLLEERSRMLDVLAHEVRQPLNNASAALQSADTVLRSHQDPEASTRLLRAQRVVGQVMARIDNTLAAAELVAGGRPIERQDADIDTLIALAVADMPVGERERVRVERLTRTRTASMDLNLMRLALRNVLSNALDHSPRAEAVTVRVADSDDPLALLFDVADRGPGVGLDVLPHLFERGARGASVPGRPSLGLGLYIVRRVMELHGGRVELAANGPDGATMRLWLNQSGPE